MKHLLYIKLFASKNLAFGLPKEFTADFDNVFDLDNFSSVEVIDLGIEFLQSQNLKIIIDTELDAKFHVLIRLIQEIKDRSELDLEVIGKNSLLQNYLSS